MGTPQMRVQGLGCRYEPSYKHTCNLLEDLGGISTVMIGARSTLITQVGNKRLGASLARVGVCAVR